MHVLQPLNTKRTSPPHTRLLAADRFVCFVTSPAPALAGRVKTALNCGLHIHGSFQILELSVMLWIAHASIFIFGHIP
jgi:hypothetical protein